MLRIAVLTSIFPSRERPYHGRPIYQTVRALRVWANVEVFCPSIAYPQPWLSQPERLRDKRMALPGDESSVRVHYIGYPALPLLTRPFNGYSYARAARPHLEEFRPHLILGYWVYPDGHAAVALGRKLGVPVIVGSRGSDLRCVNDPLVRHLVIRTLRQAPLCLTVSEELRKRAIRFGAAPGRVLTVRNGCDASVFRLRERAEARLQSGVDAEKELILFVGELIPVKGVLDLLNAAAMLVRFRQQLQVVLIGTGPLEGKLRARAQRADLAGRVHFLGPQKPVEITQWLAAANLLCLPSHSEGCPNVVMEALSCGRAVVASDVGGVPELIDSTCGTLVSPGKPAALARALEEGLARNWDEAAIAARWKRSWEDVARETYQACLGLVEEHAESSDAAAD